DGDLQRFKRLGIRPKVLSFACEHEKVAERAAPGIDFGANVTRYRVGLGGRYRAASYRGWDRQGVDATAWILGAMRIERRKFWRVHSWNGWKVLKKHGVGPIAQGGHRSEVRSQRQHVARTWICEPIADDVVDVDVRATEAVD